MSDVFVAFHRVLRKPESRSNIPQANAPQKVATTSDGLCE